MTMHFSESHEWARMDGEEVVIGLSRFAAEEIGDIIHIEPPRLGRTVARGETVAEIESVKSVNEFYSPVAGEIVAVNPALEERPELVNDDPEQAGWLARLRPSAGDPFAGLLDEAVYRARVTQ